MHASAASIGLTTLAAQLLELAAVQIEQLVLEECGGRVVRGDRKDPHEFEQLVLKVSGRRSLSSRNKKIAFRLSVRDRDFRKQQVG